MRGFIYRSSSKTLYLCLQNEDGMTFRLRDILKERQITIGQFAELSGISQSNLSNYMMGKVSPTLETLNKIAEALRIPITELFRKEEEVVLLARYGGKSVEISAEELIEFIKAKRERTDDGNRKNQ